MENKTKKVKKVKSNKVSLKKTADSNREVDEFVQNGNDEVELLVKDDEINSDDEYMENEDSKETDTAPKKRKKRGIIYLSSLPKHMKVTTVREFFSEYGTVKRIFLQPATSVEDKTKMSKSKRRFHRSFTEGWVEFESKSKAKRIATHLNTQPITDKKHSIFSGMLWNIKYIPRFKWTHLSERLAYENAVHRQKMTAEISQAKKEAAFFQNNLDHSDNIKKKNKNNKT